MGRADDELRREFPKETDKYELEMDRMRFPDAYAKVQVEYCEEPVEEGGHVKVCDAALGANGRCPYEKHHLEAL